MGRNTQVYTISIVAEMINEALGLLDVIAADSDNIDYGEMIYVSIGTDENIVALTRRGIESLHEFIADVRTWPGGMRQFLIGEMCDPDTIERIMAKEPR